jgi:hypothetical protein
MLFDGKLIVQVFNHFLRTKVADLFFKSTGETRINGLNNRRLEVGGFADRGLKVQQYRQALQPV